MEPNFNDCTNLITIDFTRLGLSDVEVVLFNNLTDEQFAYAIANKLTLHEVGLYSYYLFPKK